MMIPNGGNVVVRGGGGNGFMGGMGGNQPWLVVMLGSFFVTIFLLFIFCLALKFTPVLTFIPFFRPSLHMAIPVPKEQMSWQYQMLCIVAIIAFLVTIFGAITGHYMRSQGFFQWWGLLILSLVFSWFIFNSTLDTLFKPAVPVKLHNVVMMQNQPQQQPGLDTQSGFQPPNNANFGVSSPMPPANTGGWRLGPITLPSFNLGGLFNLGKGTKYNLPLPVVAILYLIIRTQNLGRVPPLSLNAAIGVSVGFSLGYSLFTIVMGYNLFKLGNIILHQM